MRLFAGSCLWAISSSSLLSFTPSSLLLFLPPDGDSLSQLTYFRDVFSPMKPRFFSLPSRLVWKWEGEAGFGFVVGFFFPAINNFSMLKRQESKAGIRLH